MASQIEQTVASLAALSKEYTIQLDDFFKRSDLRFQEFRTARLTKVRRRFRRIESQLPSSPSPVKLLRKKRRRKPKKATRTGRDAKRHDAHSDGTHSMSNSNDQDASLSQPSAPHSDAPEIQIQQAHSSSEPACTQFLQSKREKPEKETFVMKPSSAGRSSGSTASFRSAVESPMRDLGSSKVQNSDNRSNNLHHVQSQAQSPDPGESQWKDCMSDPEPSSQRASKGSQIGEENAINKVNSQRVSFEGTPVRNANRAKFLATSPKDNPVKSGIDVSNLSKMDLSGDEHPEKLPQDELVARGISSIAGRPQEISGSSEGAQTLPRSVKRKVNVNGASSTSREEKDDHLGKGVEDEGRSYDRHPSLSEDIKPENQIPRPNSSEKAANQSSNTSEDYKNDETSTSLSPQADHVHKNEFEFKAPKPRAMTAHPTSSSFRFERHAPSDQLREKAGFHRHFKVDEGGKINDAGIGILSKIASTPVTSSRTSDLSACKDDGDKGVLQTARLFKPTTDIYSGQRKPALSRILSTQKSDTSSRASILAHTPGAHAPTSRLGSQSLLAGPNTNGLRDSLAALKQPITESKLTQPRQNLESNNKAAWNERLKSLLRSDKVGEDAPTDGKRLTFADGYIQLDGKHNQAERMLEPQTAPTKEFRQPRIRIDMEKSALRRRIEEIRGKTSSSTITNPTSPNTSSIERMRGSSSQSNAGRRESRAKTRSTGSERTFGSPERLSSPSPEVNKVSSMSEPVTRVASEVGSQEILALERGTDQNYTLTSPGSMRQPVESGLVPNEGLNGRLQSRTRGSVDQAVDETNAERDDEMEVETSGPMNTLTNLMSSVSSLCPGATNLLGVRSNDEFREESVAEVAVKRQRLDMERREAERLARIEAQRVARQKEAEEKQRRAEARRQILAAAEKTKEDDRRRKEEQRLKAKRIEEEQKRRKKWEEDRKREERRRLVLEKKALQQEQMRRKAHDGKRQRVGKHPERGVTGIPKPAGLGGKLGKSIMAEQSFVKGSSPDLSSRTADSEQNGTRDGDGTASYAITPAKATLIEESDEETERRRHKVIPQWAGERSLAASAHSQPDPDGVFVNMPMCNLKDVFGDRKQYRTRSSSANWTQDRVTTAEMTRYRKVVGGFRDTQTLRDVLKKV